MMPPEKWPMCYRVAPLAEDRVAQAYPILQASGSRLTFDQWRALAGRAIGSERDPPGGILAAVCARDYIRALGLYSLVERWPCGRVFDLDLLLPQLLNRSLLAAIARAAEGCAREHGCRALHIINRDDLMVGDPEKALRAALAEIGFRDKREHLCKRFR